MSNKLTKEQALKEIAKLNEYVQNLPDDDMISPPDSIKLYADDGGLCSCVAIDDVRTLNASHKRGWKLDFIKDKAYPMNNADYYFKPITLDEAIKLEEIVYKGTIDTRNITDMCRYIYVNANGSYVVSDSPGGVATGSNIAAQYHRIVKRGE